MRASRLVALLLLLQARGGLSARLIAEELEVSVRTVHRDVEALAQAGVPIYAERGRHGGIRLVAGYRTRLTGLTEDEAEAMFLSGVPGAAAELGLGTVVAAARLKILAALPPELRSRAARLNQRFHLDAPDWFRQVEPTPCLADLAASVWEDRRIRLSYDRGDRHVERVVEPLGLVLKGGTWYLVAGVDGQVRTYRVSRVLSVEALDERFGRSEEFDLGAYWAESTAAYERATPRVEAVIRVDPDRLRALGDLLGPAVAATAERLPRPVGDPWEHVRLRLDWPTEAHQRILGLGAAAEVLGPAALRARVAAEVGALRDRYLVEGPAEGTAGPAPS